MKRVISLWLPRFATDRTSRATPASRDRPLALVLDRRARLGLQAVNMAAERAGLRPGMALADARAILPSLAVLPARPDEDARALARLAGWCGRYSPWTTACGTTAEDEDVDEPSRSLEGAGGGGLWLDATGCAHLFGGEEAMLADMTGRLGEAGFSVRAAMADTPGCAWAMARFAGGEAPWAVVPPGGARDALTPLPVAALRLSAATVAGLHSLGVRRIADLLALPPAPLATRFGPAVRARLEAALGTAAEPISPARPAPSHLVRLAFAEPVGRIEDIAAALDRLLVTLCRGLERTGHGVRRLVLLLYRTDGSAARLAIGTARPNRDPAHLARLFAGRLDAIDAGFGIEEAVLAAIVTDPLGAVQTALARKEKTGETAPVTLDALIDRLGNRLGNRLGTASVLRPALRQSHLPERAAGLVSVFDGAAKDRATAPLSPSPRPARLLRPPEPVETVTDGPDGPPCLFRWRRMAHRVARLEGPERIAPEWWREDPGGTRDYYRVEDTDGRRFWLYREDTGTDHAAWYLHGLFG